MRRKPTWRRHLCIVSSPEELPIEFRQTKFGLVSWVVLVKHSQEVRTCKAAAVVIILLSGKPLQGQGTAKGHLQNPIHVPIKPRTNT